jgi:large subunit ribosomal protein L13
MNHTFIPSSKFLKKKWYLVDATNKTLGRLSTEIAILLQGKNKVTFCPSVDMGDYVIVINIEKINISGNKFKQKLYKRHSGRPGGMKIETFNMLQKRIPERILEKAIKGMLPKGILGRTMYTRLKLVQGLTHVYKAQQPEIVNFEKTYD